MEYDSLNFYPSAVANLKHLFKQHWPRLLPGFLADCADPGLYRDQLRHLAADLWPTYGYTC